MQTDNHKLDIGSTTIKMAFVEVGDEKAGGNAEEHEAGRIIDIATWDIRLRRCGAANLPRQPRRGDHPLRLPRNSHAAGAFPSTCFISFVAVFLFAHVKFM